MWDKKKAFQTFKMAISKDEGVSKMKLLVRSVLDCWMKLLVRLVLDYLLIHQTT